MNVNIAIKVSEVKDAKCGDARQRLADERNHLAEIERNMRDNAFNAGQEKDRTDRIIEALAKEIRSCHEDVFGLPFTETLATV